ncbi:MAG: glycosyl hydrolase [Bacteroidota bacterium]|nr:glycosyl hydrolase [Bacteroidota bacterium]
MINKTLSLAFAIALTISSIIISLNTFAQDKNYVNSKYLYQTYKPYTRWWWFASMIKEDDVRYQLDWVKANNFGGVEIAFVYPQNARKKGAKKDTTYTPRQAWQSKEWTDIVAFTKRYADSIGLGCDFTFGTGWPFGDTKVPREESTQTYNEKNDSAKWTYLSVSWEYPKKGFIMNHMDSIALKHYADRMGNALKPAMKGSASALFCDSWEVETRKIWTKGFDTEFQHRYGYDVKPFMDNILKPDNADVFYDYMRLVGDYVMKQFYIPYTQMTHKLGGFARVQVTGAPVDLITGFSHVDVPESEAMLYNPYFSKIAASAAALSSKNVVSSETFTCTYGYPKDFVTGKILPDYKTMEKVADLKLVADAMFANGVNQIFWHGMPFNPIGCDSLHFYASVHVGAKGNLSGNLSEFNSYLQKVSEFMRKGNSYSEVAVYLPTEDQIMKQELPKELRDKEIFGWGEYEMRYVKMPEEVRGYHPLWINNDFLSKAEYKNGKLICGELVFSSLYIDVNYMDINSLRTISVLAEKGFPICLKKNPKQPGKNKSLEYENLLSKLKGFKNVSNDFTKVQEDKPLLEGKDLPEYWCRKEGENYYLFIANPQAKDLQYPLKYGQAKPNKKINRKVTLNINGKTNNIDLMFTHNQSVMIYVNENGKYELIDLGYKNE